MRLLVFLFCTLPFLAKAQTELYGMHSRWSDSFGEWYLASPVERQAGTMERQYPMGEDWTQWRVQWDGYTGTIRQKWTNRPDQWEVRYANQIVTMRMVYPGDLNSWRIVGVNTTLTWERPYRNLDAKWVIRSDSYGNFTIYTEYEGDPRDWIIVDEANEEVTTAMKLAMAFLSVYYSTPKI
jgi:hypothetical protein